MGSDGYAETLETLGEILFGAAGRQVPEKATMRSPAARPGITMKHYEIQ